MPTSFLHDGLNPVQEQSGLLTVNLLTGLAVDEFFMRTDVVGPETFFTDGLGSAVALTGATGTVQASYTYEAFGATNVAGLTFNSYNYTGRETDGTALKYYRARYYHPLLQRFLGEDPLRFGGGDVNLYAYVGNSPVQERDPLGLFMVSVGGGPECDWVTGRKPSCSDGVRDHVGGLTAAGARAAKAGAGQPTEGDGLGTGTLKAAELG